MTEITVARPRGTKGRQTQHALEDAARTLFAHRGFHGTTVADITAAAGKSPGVFYRYFTDKEHLLAELAEQFLREVVELPAVPEDDDFFVAAVTVYWEMLKPNIGIMVAVDQLAATEPRFSLLRNHFRQFGRDIVAGSLRRVQQRGHAGDLDIDHVALAIALLFERFTAVCISEGVPDDSAVRTLSTIWRNTVYGT